MGTFFHRHKGVTPYLLLAPGIVWLAIFFLIPLGFLGYESLQSGLFPNFEFTWEFSNFSNGIRDYHEQIVRSFMYAGIATVACLLLAYPLVYWIAFRAGPWRNLFLLFIVAPFFVTYLVRTLAWLNILADEGPVVGLLRSIHVLGPDGRLLATSFAVVSGITYNFLPFMALPIYVSLEQIDPRLLEAAKDLYASSTQTFLRVTLPLSAPGIVAGTLLTFIPAAGDSFLSYRSIPVSSKLRRTCTRRRRRRSCASRSRSRHPGSWRGRCLRSSRLRVTSSTRRSSALRIRR